MRVYYLECSKPLGIEVLNKYPDLQVLDARLVAGKEHLEYALDQAEKAFKRGSNISNDPLIEPIVRASAQRQIKKALSIFGVNSSRKIYVLSDRLPQSLISEYGCKEKQEEVITREKYRALKKAFGISDIEISTVAAEGFMDRVRVLQDIVKERIALLEVL